MLIEALRNWRVGATAAEELGRLRDPRALEPLIGALRGSSPEVRKAAAGALGKLGDKRAVEPLLDILGYPSDETFAADALAKLRDPRAIGPLIMRLAINPRLIALPTAQSWLARARQRGLLAVP